MNFIKLLVESLISFLLLDIVWISQVASPWMKKAVPHLMAASPNLLAALAFYLLYLGVLLFLILIPALNQKLGYPTLALNSFLFGLACYATYDLTNLAVMKGYPLTMALADMIWGGLVTMGTAVIIYRLNTR
jgi:uncharacterized membrane protein